MKKTTVIAIALLLMFSVVVESAFACGLPKTGDGDAATEEVVAS